MSISQKTTITGKIVGYEVVKPTVEAPPEPPPLESLHEKVARPESLQGMTYKIKSPVIEHALYVTINDIILNPGTPHEQRRPFEIFINSKNMDQFQWVVALTRIMSAVFRKGGDVVFLVEELKSVFDPHGGYFKPNGGGFVPSLVAEIGSIVERHLRFVGLLKQDVLPEETQALLAKKRAEWEAANAPTHTPSEKETRSTYPATASLCAKCHEKAVVIMDGCATCLACGASKCG